MKALSGFEETMLVGVDQEEPRPVSTEGHGGGVPGESDDLSRVLVLVAGERGLTRYDRYHRSV